MLQIEHASLAIYVIFICILLPILFGKNLIKKIRIRKIEGIDAIETGIVHSAETGRPISFCTGLTDISPTFFALLSILKFVAAKASLFKGQVLLPQHFADTIPVVEDCVRDAYKSTGQESFYDPSWVRFLSEEQFAYTSGYMGMIEREHVGTAFLFGHFAAEALILAEAGQNVGAFQVSGSVSPEQVPFFVAATDYTLIGEELYAAGAYLSGCDSQLVNLLAQDIGRVIFLSLVCLGVALATLQNFFPNTVELQTIISF